jgi:hypothetical protein
MQKTLRIRFDELFLPAAPTAAAQTGSAFFHRVFNLLLGCTWNASSLAFNAISYGLHNLCN